MVKWLAVVFPRYLEQLLHSVISSLWVILGYVQPIGNEGSKPSLKEEYSFTLLSHYIVSFHLVLRVVTSYYAVGQVNANVMGHTRYR